jgi:hypothetical protein
LIVSTVLWWQFASIGQKSTGHTNDATKSARLKMLSNAVRFGTSAVFFTMTPDDSNCLRIRVYAEHKADCLPHIFSATDK